MAKSVRHLTFSLAGGAGTVATRLSEAISQTGWDSRVISRTLSDLRSSPIAAPMHTASALFDEFIVKDNSFRSMISLARDRLGHLGSLPSNIDVYHLHWTNGLFPIGKAPFPPDATVVWTLHDMNPFTGVCHQSFSCKRFESDCSQCPAVHPIFQNEVRKNLERKKTAVSGWNNLKVVTPSKWLAKQASESAVFRELEVVTLLNPLDIQFFDKPIPNFFQSDFARTAPITIIAIAANLDDPIKDIGCVVRAFQNARTRNKNLRLLLAGSGGKEFAKVPGVELLGTVSPSQLIDFLDVVDVLVIPSLAENSPSVTYEAASRGVIPYVRNTAGLPEIVETLTHGLVFEDELELSDLLVTLAQTPRPSYEGRTHLAKLTKNLCHPQVIASEYVSLYEELSERQVPS